MPPTHRLAVSLAALLASTLASGCGDDPQPAPGPTPLLAHSIRNQAYLHALRDTAEAYQTAIRLFSRLTARKEATSNDWLNLARAILLLPDEDPDLGPTLAAARQRAAGDDDRLALDYLEGIHRSRSQDPKGAAACLDRVLTTDPDHPEALYQRGLVAEQARDYATARRCFQRLIDQEQLVRPAAYRMTKVTAALEDEAGQTAAIELFESRDPSEKPETLRCGFTEISLRPHDRAQTEPGLVQLAFQSQPISPLPEAIQQVLPVPAGDGSTRLLLLGRSKVLERQPDGRLLPTSISVEGEARGVIADLDQKPGSECVLVHELGWRTYSRTGDGKYAELTMGFPARGTSKDQPRAPVPRWIEAFDEDHDGDLDLLVVTGGLPAAIRVLRNNGDGSFAWKPERNLPCAPTGPVQIDAHDLDQANDLDLVVPGSDQAVVVSLNLRGDRYREEPVEALRGREIFLVEDFDNDGAPDLFATGATPGFALLRNADRRGRRYRVRWRAVEVGEAPLVRAATAADLDNDGDLDVLLGTAEGILPLQNRAGRLVPLPPIGSADIRGIVTADLDGDGTLEIVGRHATGQVVLVRITPSPGYDAIVLAPEGRKDNRTAIGTVAEVFVGDRFQSRMLKSPLGTRFGLGPSPRGEVDGVRLRWPQGIVQATPREKLDLSTPRLTYRQIEGLVASCPFLYVRGTDGWTFHTDVLGIAPLAEWLPPDGTPHLDPEEFVRIPGDRLAVRDGVVELALTEELKETTYLDRIELRFADHDPDTLLLLDENLTQGAYDPLRIHAIPAASLTPPAAARGQGASSGDGLAQLRAVDGDYFRAFHPSPSQWGGWSEPFTLELTTAAPTDTLVMTGRLAWYDSAVAYALAQNGRSWQPLRIGLPQGRGTRILVNNAGGPTGMDRNLVIPLGQTLPAGTVLWLSGQHRFLWDRIATTVADPSAPQPKVETAALTSAVLYPHGYSAFAGDPADLTQSYVYEDRRPDDRYPRARGFTNPYGPVTPLLRAHDDRLAILVAGDGIRVRFAAPEVPAGKARTWFLRLSGWAKESGFHNATGEEIAPLPFRGMRAYPPGAGERTPWKDAAKVLTRRVR